MKYDRIRYHLHARKRMRRRKISRAQVERTLQNPDRTYESWGKLAVEGVTAEGEALVLSVKRRRGTSEGERREP